MASTIFPSFKYFISNTSNILDIVLHGGDYNMDSPFINEVIKVCREKGNSVIAFNFSYADRGGGKASEGLVEEIGALRMIIDRFAVDADSVRLVGKSLGAIVAGEFLKKVSKKDLEKYSLIVLGYASKWIDICDFPGKISIIQGEKDKYGDIQAVKKHLKNAKSKNISYYEVKGADHSFNDPKTTEPKYLQDAMKTLASLD